MTRKLRVGVIFGGRSGEHEVSLASATSVMHALNREKYEVIPIGITPGGKWISSGRAMAMLKDRHVSPDEPERCLLPEPNRRALVGITGNDEPGNAIDVVFPLVHGTYGEDGTLQGLLELSGIPYVGGGVLASAVGMDKIVQKQLFRSAGLPIVRYLPFLSSDCRSGDRKTVARIEKTFRYPVFVKPANTGSSVGIAKAHGRKELEAGLRDASRYDRKIIVEEGITGVREIECSVLGNDDPIASVPGEIIPSNEFYDYDAKYVDGKSQAVIPARLPAAVKKKVRELAVRAFRTIDCAGMARVDFFVTQRSGRVYLNEVNTIPGFTSISMYPKLWEASGISYAELLDRLIELAMRRHRELSGRKTTVDLSKAWYKERE
jgi:D-alanine-D-alanine ligase